MTAAEEIKKMALKAQCLASDLDDKVLELILEFEQDTGLNVSDVNLMKTREMGQRLSRTIGANVEVTLV